MTKPIPARPNLEFDRKQAKALLDAVKSGQPEARERFEAHHPCGLPAEPRLADALLVVAREYGFRSWPQWKAFVETRTMDRRKQAEMAARAVCSNDLARARVLLRADPGLAREDVYLACACGEVETVKAAIGRDAGIVNRKGGVNGWEPLQYACFSRWLRADPERTRGNRGGGAAAARSWGGCECPPLHRMDGRAMEGDGALRGGGNREQRGADADAARGGGGCERGIAGTGGWRDKRKAWARRRSTMCASFAIRRAWRCCWMRGPGRALSAIAWDGRWILRTRRRSGFSSIMARTRISASRGSKTGRTCTGRSRIGGRAADNRGAAGGGGGNAPGRMRMG